MAEKMETATEKDFGTLQGLWGLFSHVAFPKAAAKDAEARQMGWPIQLYQEMDRIVNRNRVKDKSQPTNALFDDRKNQLTVF